jgi:4-amino-4-deoxy-L-arabinose transferase-like glycosyltransferase
MQHAPIPTRSLPLSSSLPLPLWSRALPAARQRLVPLLPLLPAACLVLVALVVGGSALHWIWLHPEVGGWDQIGYADELAKDLVAKAQGGWGALRDSLFLTSRHHPPGVRLLALPLGLVGLADMTTLRLASCLSIGLTAWLVFATARMVTGRGAAMLAAAAFLVAPVTLAAAQDWMSEVLLLPALAGLLWCLARECRPVPPRGNALLAGLCLAAGLLARLSFLPQVAPALLVATVALLVLAPARWPRLGAALAVTLVFAWPHWALNGGRYIGYARYALQDWHTHEISGEGPLGYPGQWLAFVADWAFGPLMLVALILGLAAAVSLAWRGWRARRLARFPWPWVRWGVSARFAVLGLALLLAAPPVAGHFLASNHNPRFLLAALPGLAVAMAIGIGAGRARLVPISAALVGGQALLLLLVAVWAAPSPLAGLRAAQARPALECDWRPLLSRLVGAEPKVLLLGTADGFNQVQVRYAFHRSGRAVEVTETPIGADALGLAGGADAVLALQSADERDVANYRRYFRQVPESAGARLSLATPDQLVRLRQAGFRDAGEVEAPGEGACRARMLVR